MEKQLVANLYNPANFSKDKLIERFVVRLDSFQRIYKELKASDMNRPDQQYLIRARRGMGKTTLLLRLAYEMERDTDLNDWMLPVVFHEEEYFLDQLELFWERVAAYLEEHYPTDFFGLEQAMKDLYPTLGDRPELFEEKVFELLLERLREYGKKIVIFIDNFGDIYQNFDDWEVQRLRTILQTVPDLRIVGASSVILNDLYDARHPFYEFFRIIELKGLKKRETTELLLSLADSQGDERVKKVIRKQPQRVEVMRRLTGGVIRTVVLLYEVFAEVKEGRALRDLEIIVDRTTPLYQDRMKGLSKQQQKIVHAIAKAWDGVTAREISEVTRLTTKTISSQLMHLVRDGSIERRQIPKSKNNLYLINERFFNIWYLMRFGRSDRRVLWLTRFLEDWCVDKDSLTARTRKHIKALQDGTYAPDSAYLMSEALASARGLPYKVQHELLTTTKAYLEKHGSKWKDQLSESDQSLWKRAKGFLDKASYKEMISCLERMKEKEHFWLGYSYHEIGAHDKAIENYLLAASAGDLVASYNLGILYWNEYKDYDKARKHYTNAVEGGNVDAINNLASLYKNNQKYEEAVKYYLIGTEKGDMNSPYNLALLYENQYRNFEQAKKYYHLALDRGHPIAPNNLALVLEKQYNDLEKAEKYYLMSANRGSEIALYNLGIFYGTNYKNYDKAEKYSLMAFEKGDNDSIYYLTYLYQNHLNNPVKAKAYYELAIKKRLPGAHNGLAWFYFSQRQAKEDALRLSNIIISQGSQSLEAIHTTASILLWDNQYLASFKQAHNFLYDDKFITETEQEVSDFLLLCLAKNQYDFVYDYFTGERGRALNVQDRLKPVWYTLMHYLKDKYPTEYLRMGGEVEETVREMVAKVEEYRERYQ